MELLWDIGIGKYSSTVVRKILSWLGSVAGISQKPIYVLPFVLITRLSFEILVFFCGFLFPPFFSALTGYIHRVHRITPFSAEMRAESFFIGPIQTRKYMQHFTNFPQQQSIFTEHSMQFRRVSFFPPARFSPLLITHLAYILAVPPSAYCIYPLSSQY